MGPRHGRLAFPRIAARRLLRRRGRRFKVPGRLSTICASTNGSIREPSGRIDGAGTARTTTWVRIQRDPLGGAGQAAR